MEVKKPAFALYLDTRKEKSNNKFPVKLRVTFLRKRDYINLGIDLKLEDFNKLNSPHLKKTELVNIKTLTEEYILKAKTIANQMEAFYFKEFKLMFLETNIEKEEKKQNILNVFTHFEIKINKLNNENRIGTASSNQTALNSLKNFNEKISFNDITPEFLNSYENYMLSEGKSSTTVGIYLRALRSIYNTAIEDKIIDNSNYPFRKFQIPAGKNIKKAISENIINELYNYKAELYSNEDKAKDFWFFSYFCNGINMKDVCKLKFSNLDNNKLVFVREKTKNTTKGNSTPILIQLGEDALRIINKWSGSDKNKTDYIFPILKSGIDAKKEKQLVENFTKFINKNLAKITKKLKINEKVTTFTARHSFATILKKGGTSIESISESLGHSNTKTTKSYLDSFDDSERENNLSILTRFKNGN